MKKSLILSRSFLHLVFARKRFVVSWDIQARFHSKIQPAWSIGGDFGKNRQASTLQTMSQDKYLCGIILIRKAESWWRVYREKFQLKRLFAAKRKKGIKEFSFLAAKSFSLELEEIYKKQTKLVYLRSDHIIVPRDKFENNRKDLYNIKTISGNSILVPKHNLFQ